MNDRRSSPNPHYVDSHTPGQIAQPIADLLDRPDGRRERQLIFGDAVTILGEVDGFSYIRSDKDGYIGFLTASALADRVEPSHRVSALATHVYCEADIKSPDRATLSFGSILSAVSETGAFIETSLGFVPKVHLKPHDQLEDDPVKVALQFLGTPYLWGGNSRLGIDCSGLIQAALLACGMDCPGDSDQQCDQVGSRLPEGSDARAGDLFFWPGHVSMAVDGRTMIHANAFRMATTLEPISAAKKRIDAAGDGPLLAHKRL